MTDSDKNILVAPLNWGLGHATRCIPIINELLENNFVPILASDGGALALLRKEFPKLQTLELPSYGIEYGKNPDNFKWKLLKNTPKMIEAIYKEKQLVKKWIEEYNLGGIISDNRPGVFNNKVQSVFITHQLKVLSGNTTWISSKIHQFIIKNFDECWIPDEEEKPNLSGKLGHLKKTHSKFKYIGALSRFNKIETPQKFDLMVILSGPEPQRGILEKQLRIDLQNFEGRVVFICGRIEAVQKMDEIANITFYNFMTTTQLEMAFNESLKVLCRSGYTTIMDLAKLQKKAFFIPTPGQYEQEYLAKKLKKEGLLPFALQENFRIANLFETDLYKGLPVVENKIHWKNLFCLFECKGKF